MTTQLLERLEEGEDAVYLLAGGMNLSDGSPARAADDGASVLRACIQ